MPQARDAALVEHLARVVMGWNLKTNQYGDLVDKGVEGNLLSGRTLMDGMTERWLWNPLDSWADAGMVWEAARVKGIHVRLSSPYTGDRNWFAERWLSENKWQMTEADSGPRAICEAVAKETGWQEPEGGDDVGR